MRALTCPSGRVLSLHYLRHFQILRKEGVERETAKRKKNEGFKSEILEDRARSNPKNAEVHMPRFGNRQARCVLGVTSANKVMGGVTKLRRAQIRCTYSHLPRMETNTLPARLVFSL